MSRLLIAAPSAMVRAGLEALAASSAGLQVVGSVPDLSADHDLNPDVVLAALPLEEVPPPSEGETVPVVLITNDAQPAWSIEALRLGVRALLPRDASSAEILAAVEAAANGLAVLDPQDLDTLLSSSTLSPAQTEAGSETSELTTREREVLHMLSEGAANKIIAWKLRISDHTVKFHVASIFAKLGASSRTEAVTIGIRRGLVLL